MNQFAERHVVTQMHRDQVTSATITIDDGGGVLRIRRCHAWCLGGVVFFVLSLVDANL